MAETGFIYHEASLRHDTGIGHPERKERLEAILHHLKGTGSWKTLTHLTPQASTLDSAVKVHRESYVRWVENQCKSGETLLDSGDTHVCSESFDIALLAAGAVQTAVDQVMDKKLKNAFCAVRPPGHHAETSRAMGFCLFNNVAIGARYAQERYSVERVAIVDWDVHHGNGTQEIFYADPSVFYVSLHQFPLWPGTGASDEDGMGKGKGFTLNCPMRPGSGEREYLEEFREKIIPRISKFHPDLILISSGFDAHKEDPLANIQLTEHSFSKMTTLVRQVADECCEGRIVSVLEGGYNLQALARSVENHLRVLQE